MCSEAFGMAGGGSHGNPACLWHFGGPGATGWSFVVSGATSCPVSDVRRGDGSRRSRSRGGTRPCSGRRGSLRVGGGTTAVVPTVSYDCRGFERADDLDDPAGMSRHRGHDERGRYPMARPGVDDADRGARDLAAARGRAFMAVRTRRSTHRGRRRPAHRKRSGRTRGSPGPSHRLLDDPGGVRPPAS